MKTIEIKGNVREVIGKKSSRDLRKQELVPCVMYGGEKNIHFCANEKEFTKLVYTPSIFEVKLNLDGNTSAAVIRDIQFHPVTDKIMHVDFYEVNPEKLVTIAVPVKTIGTPAGVMAGGAFNLKLRKLKVQGLMKNIPDTLEVHVADLTIGKMVRVRELSYENLTILEAPSNVVAVVSNTRSSRAAAAAAEGKK